VLQGAAVTAVHPEPRRVLASIKGVSPKRLDTMDQRMRTGGAKQRKDVFREFMQDVIRKANPGQPQAPKKPTISELPEKVIIRKSMAAQRARDDDLLPVYYGDGDDL
jgi:hypothetical protein